MIFFKVFLYVFEFIGILAVLALGFALPPILADHFESEGWFLLWLISVPLAVAGVATLLAWQFG